MAGEPFDTDLELLPDDGSDISADAELNAVLGHVLPLLPEDDPTDPVTPQPLGRGWAFDFQARTFLRRGAAPMQVEGLDNLRTWIEKTLYTARFAHPIYTSQYGTDDYELIGEIPTPDQISRYEMVVIEALMVHDRISDVGDFDYAQDPNDDALYVSFIVETDAGTLEVDRIQVA